MSPFDARHPAYLHGIVGSAYDLCKLPTSPKWDELPIREQTQIVLVVRMATEFTRLEMARETERKAEELFRRYRVALHQALDQKIEVEWP